MEMVVCIKNFIKEGTVVSGIEIKAGNEYIFEINAYGGLLVGGFTAYGFPLPGIQSKVYESTHIIVGVEKEYFEHGNGD